MNLRYDIVVPGVISITAVRISGIIIEDHIGKTMLKSLELHGFKSFADKTVFEFSKGITGVVGPNGSGKSNVVDGIKWVLGDQSAKSLRSKEMTDIIFNGAAGRKASNFSEVSLLFDNTSRFFPTEFDEVQIGRKLWRNGDSEYLINHIPVRLKDIKRLFLNSSAGTAEYCIIEQGRVDQILQASAQNRRRIFEEAAGISLFKTRKSEFLRRMERVEQHLLRLQDIVDEVESQLLSLKSQAEKAAKYREVSSELRTLWIGLSADEYRDLDAGYRKDSEQLQKLVEEIGIVREKQSIHDDELLAIESQIQTIEKEQRSIVQRRTRYLESIARNQTVVSQLGSRLQELAFDRIRLTNQESLLANRYRAVTEEFEQTRKVSNGHEEIIKAKENEIEKIVAESEIEVRKFFDLKENIELGKNEQEEIRKRLAQIEIEERTSETEHRAVIAAKETAIQEISGIESLLEETCQDRVQIENVHREIETQHQTFVEKLETAENERKGILENQSDRIQNLFSLRERRSASLARKTILDDLEKKQEGIGIGAKEIINRARTAHIAPWNDIPGTVVDLLTVDFSHSAVIEAALGERTQWIVTQNLPFLLEHLQEEALNIQGRVTFIDSRCGEMWQQNDKLQSRRQPTDSSFETSELSLENERGVITRADNLAEFENRYTTLIESLLGDTWVVETLEDAIRLAIKTNGEGYRFVTLQGELLSSTGVAVVGSIHAEDSPVSRRSELRQLKTDLENVEQIVSRESEVLNSMDSDLVEIELHIEKIEVTVRETLEQRAVIREKRKRVVEKQEETNRLLEEKRRDFENIDRKIRDFGERFETFEQTREVEFGRIESLQETIVENERKSQALENSKKECEARIQKMKINLVQFEEQRKNSLSSFEKLDVEKKMRLQQSEESTRRLTVLKQQLQKSHLEVLRTESRLAECYLSEEGSESQLKLKNEEKQEWTESRTHLRTTDAELQKQRRTLDEAKMTIDMRCRNVERQKDLLCERIEEEFQEVLTDFVESGESALELHLLALREESIDDDEVEEIDRDDEWESSPNASSLLDRISNAEKTKLRERLESQLKKLRKRMKSLGNVNTDSLEHLDELQNRFAHLKTTMDDLVEAKNHLNELVEKIDKRCKEMFVETFDAIRANFQDLFRRAFGGGVGDIVLEDKEDVLECGIDIVAKPPGKELKSISLMSGGEKTLTAFAMLLAMFRHRPSPYCILDEVDATLDEANVERMLGLLNEFKDSTQFVIITHKKPTMTITDLLYGVTMEEAGISKRLTVKFENVGENGEFLADDRSESQDQAA